jgi:LemA protein
MLIPIRIQAASALAASSAPQLTDSKPASPPPCRLDVILNAKWNKEQMNPVLYVITLILILFVSWAGFTFNRFIRQRNWMREAWSGVDVQLKRRHDLIPRLVECVKAYRDFEASVLENLAAARTNVRTVKDVPQTGKVENGVTQTLRSLLAVAEAYPDLKASRNFQDLSAALIDTEDQLQYARRYYNGTVRVVARIFGFRPDGYFEVESSTERQAPEVKL